MSERYKEFLIGGLFIQCKARALIATPSCLKACISRNCKFGLAKHGETSVASCRQPWQAYISIYRYPHPKIWRPRLRILVLALGMLGSEATHLYLHYLLPVAMACFDSCSFARQRSCAEYFNRAVSKSWPVFTNRSGSLGASVPAPSKASQQHGRKRQGCSYNFSLRVQST